MGGDGRSGVGLAKFSEIITDPNGGSRAAELVRELPTKSNV
jgi:hypothetical protein